MINQKQNINNIMIEAIDVQIKQYKELIRQLDEEKRRYLNLANQTQPYRKILRKAVVDNGESGSTIKTTFNRLVDALKQMPEIFTRVMLKEGAEKDNLGEIKEGTFSPSFSKLIKQKKVIEVEKGFSGNPSKYRIGTNEEQGVVL
jgi:hypothetical protein